MDKIAAILLIALLAMVTAVSLSYCALNQPNQNQNNPSPTPTPTPSPSGEPTSIPKPSVPEFTVEYADNSYDVPPTQGVDQYTGEKVVIEGGYHVDNRTIEFTIKNQPFNPYVDASGNNISLYYYFRYKGPYGDDWSYYPDTSHTYGYYVGLFPDTSASNSEYTVIGVNFPTLEIPIDSEVEFQVQSIMGYVDKGASISMFAGGYMGFTGERSGWSETQTITIP